VIWNISLSQTTKLMHTLAMNSDKEAVTLGAAAVVFTVGASSSRSSSSSDAAVCVGAAVSVGAAAFCTGAAAAVSSSELESDWGALEATDNRMGEIQQDVQMKLKVKQNEKQKLKT
jgi:hypothetical protein